jgi:hypothetical protein
MIHINIDNSALIVCCLLVLAFLPQIHLIFLLLFIDLCELYFYLIKYISE